MDIIQTEVCVSLELRHTMKLKGEISYSTLECPLCSCVSFSRNYLLSAKFSNKYIRYLNYIINKIKN